MLTHAIMGTCACSVGFPKWKLPPDPPDTADPPRACPRAGDAIYWIYGDLPAGFSSERAQKVGFSSDTPPFELDPYDTAR